MTYISSYDGVTHYSVTETAALIRKALKKGFPSTKFSVRSSKYAGGASVDISWTDGPTAKQVDAVTQVFSGKGFDGMIDLAYYKSYWLDPKTGEVTLAHREGTTGSVTEIIQDPHSATAIAVTFGADYVQTHRDFSPEVKQAAWAEVATYAGVATPERERDVWGPLVGVSTFKGEISGAGLARNDHRDDNVGTLAFQLLAQRDFSMPVECAHVETYGCGVGKPQRCFGCGKEQ